MPDRICAGYQGRGGKSCLDAPAHRAGLCQSHAGTGENRDCSHVVHEHPGWGGSLFALDIFLEAAQVSFFEWFYRRGADYAFRARGKARPAKQFSANRMRNHVQLDALRGCHSGIVPRMWQFASIPWNFIKATDCSRRCGHGVFLTPGRGAARDWGCGFL